MFKILFIDDEISILEVTKLLLSSLRFEGYFVNSGKLATEILSDKAKQQEIKIIFLDLTMPKMSGLELLEWINKNNIKIPTILQTGIEDKKEIEKAKALGIKDYVIKPYTKEQLNQLIIIRKLGKANEYDLLGMLYLQTKQFQKADEWIEKAIIADKNNISFQLHKAHFYLFTNEASKAKDIHKKYRNQNINSKLSWKDATIKDFENFKKLGLPDDGFNKIIRILD